MSAALPPRYQKKYPTLLSLLRFSYIPPPLPSPQPLASSAVGLGPSSTSPKPRSPLAPSPRITSFSKHVFRNIQTFSPRGQKRGLAPQTLETVLRNP